METRKGLQMKLLLCLANLLLLMIGSTVAQSCAQSLTCPQCSACNGADQILVLGSLGRTAQVPCTAQAGGMMTWERVDATGQTLIAIDIVNDPKYGSGPTRLDIMNVVAGDEGRYRCSYPLGSTSTACLFVPGTAVFASCGSQSCPVEMSTVQAGREIVFDTRITFINSGSCDIPQNITFLQLFRGDVFPANLLYECDATMTTVCPDSQNGAFRTVIDGSYLFNINLTKESAMMDDAGDYRVRVRLSIPGNGFNFITKTLSISVTGTVPTTTSTVISGLTTSSSQSVPTTPTAPPTTTPPTTTTSTPVPSAPTTESIVTNPTPNGVIIAAVTASVVFILAVIIIVIIIAVCVVRSSSQQKGSHTLLSIRKTVQRNSYFRAASTVTTDTAIEEETKRESTIELYEGYEGKDPQKSSKDHNV